MENNSNEITEIYLEIGKKLASRTFGLEDETDESLINRGMNWFQNKKIEVKNVLCINKKIIKLQSGEESDNQKILLLIIDAISAIKLIIPIASMAKLIMLIGIKNICKEQIDKTD